MRTHVWLNGIGFSLIRMWGFDGVLKIQDEKAYFYLFIKISNKPLIT